MSKPSPRKNEVSRSDQSNIEKEIRTLPLRSIPLETFLSQTPTVGPYVLKREKQNRKSKV